MTVGEIIKSTIHYGKYYIDMMERAADDGYPSWNDGVFVFHAVRFRGYVTFTVRIQTDCFFGYTMYPDGKHKSYNSLVIDPEITEYDINTKESLMITFDDVSDGTFSGLRVDSNDFNEEYYFQNSTVQDLYMTYEEVNKHKEFVLESKEQITDYRANVNIILDNDYNLDTELNEPDFYGFQQYILGLRQ
jgi:hypothetical protein